MKQPPSRFEWALALYDYPGNAPSPEVFSKFFGIASDFIRSVALVPSNVAVEGTGYTGKLSSFRGQVVKRLVESGFSGISALSIVACPEGSKAPSFDRLIRAGLAWAAPDELVMSMVVNDVVAPFLETQFDHILNVLLEWRRWAFGFGLKDDVARQPEIHVLGCNNGMLTREENEALERWYCAKAEDRNSQLRDVYPVNILGPQLAARVVDDQSLEDRIRRASGSMTNEVNGMLVWKVPAHELASIRARLNAHGLLIAARIPDQL